MLIRSLLTLAAASVLAQPVLAQQSVNAAGSEIVFVSKQLGVPVEGKFKKFDASVSFDPKKPEAGKISFVIDTGSAAIGAPETDAELPKPEWFNVAKFPKASFESTAIKATGTGKFDVTGKLSIKGSSQNVVVPVSLAQAGAVTTATGAFTLKRLAFKIGDGEWSDTSMVADDVQVKFKLALAGVGPL